MTDTMMSSEWLDSSTTRQSTQDALAASCICCGRRFSNADELDQHTIECAKEQHHSDSTARRLLILQHERQQAHKERANDTSESATPHGLTASMLNRHSQSITRLMTAQQQQQQEKNGEEEEGGSPLGPPSPSSLHLSRMTDGDVNSLIEVCSNYSSCTARRRNLFAAGPERQEERKAEWFKTLTSLDRLQKENNERLQESLRHEPLTARSSFCNAECAEAGASPGSRYGSVLRRRIARKQSGMMPARAEGATTHVTPPISSSPPPSSSSPTWESAAHVQPGSPPPQAPPQAAPHASQAAMGQEGVQGQASGAMSLTSPLPQRAVLESYAFPAAATGEGRGRSVHVDPSARLAASNTTGKEEEAKKTRCEDTITNDGGGAKVDVRPVACEVHTGGGSSSCCSSTPQINAEVVQPLFSETCGLPTVGCATTSDTQSHTHTSAVVTVPPIANFAAATPPEKLLTRRELEQSRMNSQHSACYGNAYATQPARGREAHSPPSIHLGSTNVHHTPRANAVGVSGGGPYTGRTAASTHPHTSTITSNHTNNNTAAGHGTTAVACSARRNNTARMAQSLTGGVHGAVMASPGRAFTTTNATTATTSSHTNTLGQMHGARALPGSGGGGGGEAAGGAHTPAAVFAADFTDAAAQPTPSSAAGMPVSARQPRPRRPLTLASARGPVVRETHAAQLRRAVAERKVAEQNAAQLAIRLSQSRERDEGQPRGTPAKRSNNNVTTNTSAIATSAVSPSEPRRGPSHESSHTKSTTAERQTAHTTGQTASSNSASYAMSSGRAVACEPSCPRSEQASSTMERQNGTTSVGRSSAKEERTTTAAAATVTMTSVTRASMSVQGHRCSLARASQPRHAIAAAAPPSACADTLGHAEEEEGGRPSQALRRKPLVPEATLQAGPVARREKSPAPATHLSIARMASPTPTTTTTTTMMMVMASVEGRMSTNSGFLQSVPSPAASHLSLATSQVRTTPNAHTMPAPASAAALASGGSPFMATPPHTQHHHVPRAATTTARLSPRLRESSAGTTTTTTTTAATHRAEKKPHARNSTVATVAAAGGNASTGHNNSSHPTSTAASRPRRSRRATTTTTTTSANAAAAATVANVPVQLVPKSLAADSMHSSAASSSTTTTTRRAQLARPRAHGVDPLHPTPAPPPATTGGEAEQPAGRLKPVPFCTECGQRHVDAAAKYCAFCGHKRAVASC